MASFRFNGMDELSASLDQLANMPDDTKWEVLKAGADVVKQGFELQLTNLFRQISGILSTSIKVSRKRGGDGPVALIAPKGAHPGSTTGKRRGKRRSNGSYQGTNAEIAYILEYGSPRISASHWMESLLDDDFTTEQIVDAEQDAFDQFVTSINL